MSKEIISKYLRSYATKKQKDYMEKLIPDVDSDRIIGVKSDDVKEAAHDMYYERGLEGLRFFLDDLPHYFIEEENVHSYIINCIEDIEVQYRELDVFLPTIDNWWTCDIIRLAHPLDDAHDAFLQEHIQKWLNSDDLYTTRFGIVSTLRHYLEDRFDVKHLDAIAAVNATEDFYLRSAVAWFFATALIFRLEETLPYLTEKRLPKLTHNHIILKCKDSTRLTEDKKDFIRGISRITKADS